MNFTIWMSERHSFSDYWNVGKHQPIQIRIPNISDIITWLIDFIHSNDMWNAFIFHFAFYNCSFGFVLSHLVLENVRMQANWMNDSKSYAREDDQMCNRENWWTQSASNAVSVFPLNPARNWVTLPSISKKMRWE